MTDISLAIDLGTSRTKVGWRDKLGEIHIVQWDGQPFLPSVFHLPSNSADILLGNDALDAMEDDPVGGIENLKRQMIEIGDMELTHPDRLENPQKLVEHLFQAIREQCLEQISDLNGQLPESVTLTLPAKASSIWRDLLEQGAEVAGFLQVEPIKEPIAAARGWLYSQQKTTATVLVLDCGGGTTDWALVEMNENRLTLSKQHRPESINLGGCDVDRALYAYLQKNNNEQIQHYSAKKLILRLKTYKEAVLSGATPSSLRIGGKVLAVDETVVKDKYQRVFIDSLFISLKPTLEAIENNFSSTQILLVGGGSAFQLKKAMSSITSLAVNTLQETGLGVLKGVLSKKFSNLNADNILQDKPPQYSIASGLYPWRRLQAQTRSFSEEIETFKENEMRQIIEDDYDQLMDTIATQLSTVAIDISKKEFKKWLDGKTTYISTVESNIKSAVEDWVKYKSKDELDPIIKIWLLKVLLTLTARVDLIEDKYILPEKIIGKSNEIDQIVRNISHLLMPTMLLAIYSILICIVNLISAKLAAIIFRIIINIPNNIGRTLFIGSGTTLMVTLMVTLIKGGSLDEVKDSFAGEIRDQNVSQWVRNSVSFDKVLTAIDAKRTSIVEEISIALKNDNNMKEKVIIETHEKYAIQLNQFIEDARLLIK